MTASSPTADIVIKLTNYGFPTNLPLKKIEECLFKNFVGIM